MWGAQLGFQMERNGPRTKECELSELASSLPPSLCFFSGYITVEKGGGLVAQYSVRVEWNASVVYLVCSFFPLKKKPVQLGLIRQINYGRC